MGEAGFCPEGAIVILITAGSLFSAKWGFPCRQQRQGLARGSPMGGNEPVCEGWALCWHEAGSPALTLGELRPLYCPEQPVASSVPHRAVGTLASEGLAHLARHLCTLLRPW